MASFSRYNLTKSFAVDRSEVQETARRQFFISAVIVAAVLCFATISSLRATVSPSYKGVEATGRVGYLTTPIKVHVRYVDRSTSEHRLALASIDD